jgi:hypothetical protein
MNDESIEVGFYYTYKTLKPKDIEQEAEEDAHNILSETTHFLETGEHLEG